MWLLHKFLCWFPAWVSGVAVAIAGMAIAGAPVWPVAKRICELIYASVLAVVTTQVFPWIAVPVVIAWLFATWWTWPLRAVLKPVAANEELHAERRLLILAGRDLVHAVMKAGSEESFREYLEASREYPSIRGLLGKDYLSNLNAQRVVFAPHDRARYPVLVSGFLDELDRLEREWKIV